MDDFLQQTKNALLSLFEHHFGEAPASTQILHSAGSNRVYIRLFRANGASVVGAYGSNPQENDAFIYLSQHFYAGSLPVPQIYAISEDHHCYLQTDLGDLSLHEKLASWKKVGYSLDLSPKEVCYNRNTKVEGSDRKLGEYSKHLGDFSAKVGELSTTLGDSYQYLRELLRDNDYPSHCPTSVAPIACEGFDLLRKTIRLLARIQIKGGESLETSHLIPPHSFDQRSIMFDLNYFKYCFLKPSGLPFDEMALEDDFDSFARRLLQCDKEGKTFLYRDFQARNVMIHDGQPWLIDFQSGRRGPLHYDVASFLWQASAQYPDALRSTLVEEYLDEVSTLTCINRTQFQTDLQLFVLFRTLQVLGAYGLRGLYERKPYFLQSIPLALKQAVQLVENGTTNEYPTLSKILLGLAQSPLSQQYKSNHA